MASAKSVQVSTTKALAVMAQSACFHPINLWINPGHGQRAGALLRKVPRNQMLRLRNVPDLRALNAVRVQVARPVPLPKAAITILEKAVGNHAGRAVATVAVLRAAETHIDSGHIVIDLQIG